MADPAVQTIRGHRHDVEQPITALEIVQEQERGGC